MGNNNIDLRSEMAKGLSVHTSLKQHVIVITEDKLELVLMKGKAGLESKSAWLTPFSLGISFVATLCTAEFQNAFGLQKDLWKAIFIVLTALSILWLLRNFYMLYKNRDQGDIYNIIDSIKAKSLPEEEYYEEINDNTHPKFNSETAREFLEHIRNIKS